MKTKNIYILLSDTGTLFAKAIRMYTKEKLNHVSISFNEELTECYSFGRKRPHNPLSGGFVKEDMHSYIFQRAHCEVYCLQVSESDYEKMKRKVEQISIQREMYRYNILGMIALMFQYNLKRKNAFFCSQFVATILNEGEIPVAQFAPNFMQPSHFPKSPYLLQIYEGPLRFYPLLEENRELHLFMKANRFEKSI
ncbi:hypothetical protein [Alkalihalobacillus pseudalcaliphilus]|uniref:hypothetical protein n=1 Tax=Alkalihalobacillus pseudalcaliphilus TaxID=79884 RepID=UPI00064DF676|nr:hypothetical protein [Alkalihalobacillus pseudalcaliphilus]KMK74415.1 hypothetical protein AB990_21135 [Alkalihalobacillus pseudalcaliphilus]